MSFDRLLRPRSIAVFGGGMAQEAIRQCDRMGYQGELWPVHPSKTEILGRAAYRSVEDLPGSPDAAYIGVNRQLTIDIVRDLAARGAGGAICFATGFSEAGDEGAELERRLLEASAAMPLIGPNCYGLLNYLDGAMLWPDQQGGRRVDEGVAIITMSSNVAFNLTMQRRGLPVAYVMSLGNKLKFDLHDAIRVFASEPRVTALGLYVEGISEPRAFDDAVRAARAARQAGRGGQGRPVRGRSEDGAVPHRLARRLRRPSQRAVRPRRSGPRRLDRGPRRGAQGAARSRAPAGRPGRRHEHFGRGPLPARRRDDGNPSPDHAAAVRRGSRAGPGDRARADRGGQPARLPDVRLERRGAARRHLQRLRLRRLRRVALPARLPPRGPLRRLELGRRRAGHRAGRPRHRRPDGGAVDLQ